MLIIKTLGELRLSDEGDRLSRPLRRKPLALLSYVARRAPRAVSRTELATLFWGERGEDRARQSLRQALTELKQALGDRIEVDADTVRLIADAVQLDIAVFEREAAAGHADIAVNQWTGEFFEGGEDIGGDGFRRWIEGERAALHQLLGVAMGKLVGDAELRADWAAAAASAERWAAALPLDERAHLRLIEVYRMNAQHGDALKTHAAFVARVRTVLDIEPSAEFLRLGGGLADNARTELARQGRGSAAIRTPTLVGRSAVVRELSEAWTRAATTAGGVVVLRGEAGSGLSRVCEELAERVRSDGSDSVVMQARGIAGADELSTAIALFDGVRNASGSAGAAPEALTEVARIVPALHSQFKHLPAAVGDDASLREALLQVLVAIGEEQPVLLVVDDLHDTDASSRRLLTWLAQRLPRGVLLLMTDVEDESKHDDESDELLKTRSLLQLRVSELSPGDVETMLGSMITLEPRERHDLATRLHAESGGNPQAVVALVAALVDDQLLRLDSGGTWIVAPTLSGRLLPLPPSVRARVRTRMESLSARARAVAEGLAVLAEASSASVAGEVAELSADEAELAIGELVSRRFVREDRATPGRFVLSSTLLARTIAAQTPPTRREALHARAAEVLKAHDIGATAERSLLSYHVARAARPTTAEVKAVLETRAWWRKPRVMALATTLLIAVAVVAAATSNGGIARFTHLTTTAHDSVPIIALGRITDYRTNPVNDLAKPLGDMLATNLGRVRGLRVVSSARMYELMGQQNAGDTSAGALVAAARRSGATELVDGSLYARDDGGYQLDLRRVELATGNIRQTYSFPGRTIFELADSGTAGLAADFGNASPIGSIADVTTRSIAAYRFYEAGLRAYYSNALNGAQPLFQAALKEDSTFAMAAYYAALSSLDSRKMVSYFATAARLANRTSDRERLTILAHRAYLASDPSLIPLAETLTVRYPQEVEGYYFTGLGRAVGGEFLQSLAPFNKVVAMDSLALSDNRARCQACAALRQIVVAYEFADSLQAAEREVRRWLRLQPRSGMAWNNLAEVLIRQGKSADAINALDQVAALDSGRREELRLTNLANYRQYASDFEQADRLYAGEIESGSPARAIEGFWYRTLSYRNQGRMKEALEDSRHARELVVKLYDPAILKRRRALPSELVMYAQTLMEMERYRESGAVYDSIARWSAGDESPSQNAHQFAWVKTHALAARIAAGDTVDILPQIDSVEKFGRETGLKRDHLLHHYLKGLLLAARGKDEEAIAEYRQSIFSWSFGYTRSNLAMAKSYTRLGRHSDAIAVLQPALRGDLESSNFYVARTELHELLGLAWEKMPGAAARDSAVAHMSYVVRAWSKADPMFAERRERMKSGVAALTAPTARTAKP